MNLVARARALAPRLTLLVGVMVAALMVVPARSEAPAPEREPTQEMLAVPALHVPPPADEVRGIYLTGALAASAQMDAFVELVARSRLNTIVIELKDELGNITFQAGNPWARQMGAVRGQIRDLKALVSRLHEQGIYVIGRIVAFRDHRVASRRPDLALRDREGGPWLDRHGIGWVDPTRPQVWSYLIGLAVEAALAGVDEIQWDYVRFPTDGDLDRLVYPTGVSRGEAIAAFLAEARRAVAAAGAYTSADLFGFAALTRGDMGIGHQLELVAEQVDFVSLMLYPSHFPSGAMGLSNPDRSPYETVARSLLAAAQRIDRRKLRPWLQSFSLRSPYGPQEVWEQIRAAEEMQVSGWLLWNPSGRYTTPRQLMMPAMEIQQALHQRPDQREEFHEPPL